jgi:hypothetical protein
MMVQLQVFLSSSLYEGKLSGPDLPAKGLYGTQKRNESRINDRNRLLCSESDPDAPLVQSIAQSQYRKAVFVFRSTF